MLGDSLGLSADIMRFGVCGVLLKRPDPNNWSHGNVFQEVQWLVEKCPWHKVYDIAEAFFDRLEF